MQNVSARTTLLRRRLFQRSISALALLWLSCGQAFADERPRLQIINGSPQPIDVFWLKSDTERVPNGSVAPGKDTIITTTLGHRFLIVGRDDKTEAPSQRSPPSGVPLRSAGKDGMPAFYTQTSGARISHRRLGTGESLRAQGSGLPRRHDAREAPRRAGGDDPERRAPVHPGPQRVHHRPAGVHAHGR